MSDLYSVPTPYLIPGFGFERRLNVDGLAAMALLIKEINFPPDLETNPYFQTEVGSRVLALRRVVSTGFIQKYFDKRFTGWKMPRNSGSDLKQQVKLESDIWGEVWRMIEMLYSRSLFAPDSHPALTFYKIVNEARLLQPYTWLEGESETGLTASQAARNIQGENKVLQRLGREGLQKDLIPFGRQTEPATWLLLVQCLKLAGINDDFKKQYLSVVSARMSLATHVRTNRPMLYSLHSGRKENRGRKRNNLNSTSKSQPAKGF
jgi:hypothetical protein